MSKLRTVTLIGRANVGKSTLFNRLTRSKVRQSAKSMVLDYEGVTRDLISQETSWKDIPFELVDSGGTTLNKETDHLAEEVRKKALKSVETSDVAVFVCDGYIGVTEPDRQLARHLHKIGVSTVLAVNKMDKAQHSAEQYEFAGLGFDHVSFISALRGNGVKELLNTVTGLFPIDSSTETAPESKYRLVLLGKPNVGKSSLMNQLVGKERSIVSDIEGTTREAVSEQIELFKESFTLSDTAGVRRQRSVKGEIEPLMVKSSLRAVESSDIVLLLIDGSQARLVDQELKLAFWTFTQKYKALIILVNKDDLCDEITRASFDYEVSEYKFLLKKVPLLRISCESGKNIDKIMPKVEQIWARHSQTLSDDKMTLLIQDNMIHRPLFVQKHRLTMHRIEQIATAPMTFRVIIDNWRWWGDSQRGYLENVLRSNYDLEGVPLILRFKEKRELKKSGQM